MIKIEPVLGREIYISCNDNAVSLKILAPEQETITEIVNIVHEIHDAENVAFLTVEAGKITFYRQDGTRVIPVFIKGFNESLIQDLKELELLVVQKWDELFPDSTKQG